MWRRAGWRRGAALALWLVAALAAWGYARDMRKTPVVAPQQKVLDPPAAAVPVGGREVELPLEVAAAKLKNPVPADTASLRRGRQIYATYFTPCHGPKMDGQGPVAAKYIPPPDLLAKMTRDRTDGYIYRYIRHGGAIMPKYGYALTSGRVWDVVNYLRQMQRTSPR